MSLSGKACLVRFQRTTAAQKGERANGLPRIVRAQVLHLLKTHTVKATIRALAATGVTVERAQVDSLRRLLDKRGERPTPVVAVNGDRPKVAVKIEPTGLDPDRARREATRLSCEALHKRTLALFERVAAREGCDVEMVALRLHHGAEAVAAWRAAA